MKKIIIGLIVLTVLLVQGCVPSIHPLYSAETTITDKRILGTWENNNEAWTFEKIEGKDKTYKGIYKDQTNVKNEFEVHIVKLGDEHYLDFFPAGSDVKSTDFYKVHLIPAHTFVKVNLANDNLKMQPFNAQWLEDQIKNRYIRIKHEIVENSVVITAPTLDLQKFVIKYSNHSTGEEDFFLKPTTWKKKK